MNGEPSPSGNEFKNNDLICVKKNLFFYIGSAQQNGMNGGPSPSGNVFKIYVWICVKFFFF